MTQNTFDSTKFFKAACNFEGSLIIVAALLGWFAGVNPFANLHFSELAIFYGVIGTLPLILLFIALEQFNFPSLKKIRALLHETLGAGLQSSHWTEMLMLAAIAGFAEELLFRGVLQPWFESHWGAAIALIGSNLLFGLAHAITPLYAILAALVGLYLGFSLDYGAERNLLTPILIHGLYDFVAFLLIMRSYRKLKN